MKIVVKTATEARKEFFDLINAAKYGGQETVVTKNGKKVARIIPEESKERDWEKYKRVVEAAGGIFADEDVKQIRQARIDSRKNRYPEW